MGLQRKYDERKTKTIKQRLLSNEKAQNKIRYAYKKGIKIQNKLFKSNAKSKFYQNYSKRKRKDS